MGTAAHKQKKTASCEAVNCPPSLRNGKRLSSATPQTLELNIHVTEETSHTFTFLIAMLQEGRKGRIKTSRQGTRQ